MFRQFIKSTSAQLPKRSVAQWQRIVAQPIVTRNMTAAVGNTATRFVRTYSTAPQVSTGKKEVHEFKTETKRLLDIVANSLYSEKEIFVRELISNAADALEKLRQNQAHSDNYSTDQPLDIKIHLDQEANQFIIQDSGVGMNLEELNENLGTIAGSGSKKFMEKLESDGNAKDNIIGQFGVGFYSTFMVGNKITVFTKSAKAGSKGYCWTTDGQGSYSVSEADNVDIGTKIIIELRDDCKSFASELEIDSIIKRYSNFIGFPIYLNDKQVNTIEALWKKDVNSVTPEQHTEFYRFIANAWDDPQYTLHFKTDAPLTISSVLYVPEKHMEMLGEEQSDPGVSLYSRKVLIQPKSAGLLPHYLRFIKGIVDSDDIPLNVSRELLQDNILSRLRQVMTKRVLKWLDTEAKKDPKKFNDFFLDYGQFIKEGACTDAMHKRDIAKLLRFESSKTTGGDMISLEQYNQRSQEGQKRIYYLLTPKRKYAEESPYTEMFNKKGIEILYLYDTVDEFVVNHLGKFQDYELVSADSPDLADDPLLQDDRSSAAMLGDALSDSDAKNLAGWIEKSLGDEVVKQVDVSRRLASYPAIVLEHESPAMRKMMQMMQGSAKMEEAPPTPTRLEINPDHPVMKGLFHIRQQNPDLAKLVTEQVYDNALCAAGVLDDPRSMITRLNKLLEITVQNVQQDKKVKA